MYDRLPRLDCVMTNHGRIRFEVDRTIQVDKPESGVLSDPIQNITKISSSELNVSGNYTRVDAKRDIIKFNGQLCSLPDFGTNIANEHGCIEWNVVVVIE